MGMKKYLVVHPKLSVTGEDGLKAALKKGKEISMDSSAAAKLVDKGFLKLVVTAKKVTAKAKKSKDKAKKK